MEETQLKSRPKGVMGHEYHHERLKSPGPRYRLRRRAFEAARVIQQHAPANPALLDIGTADGLMLNLVCDIVQPSIAIGMDLSWELIARNSKYNPVLMADAQQLPFATDSFDAVIATAIIEHVPQPHRFVQEIQRVLRPAGVCVLTTPVPVFEEFASKLGFLKEDDHQETFRLEQLKQLVASTGFTVLVAEKFMMSPIGFPAERSVEKWMKRFGLAPLLLNQLVAARK